MSAPKPVTIIGGGLAGLALGIGLRRADVPVTVWEAGHYPRHRVCGEFISGRGQESLARMGLLDCVKHAGAAVARSVAFYTPRATSGVRALPQTALCLPRYELDELLADEFRQAGGELREGQRWAGEADGAGTVFASGRRLQSTVDGWRWFGLKVHATGVSLEADLEMHLSSGGYVGVCRQPGGVVNACGIFRSKGTAEGAVKDWRERLRGAPGTRLRARMADAVFDEASFCAVAGINLTPQRASSQKECRIGDALTMIPPLTGNGMSIAFESAEMAINPLIRWSRGETTWPQSRQELAAQCDGLLTTRLKWAKWIQAAAMTGTVQEALVAVVSRSDWLWRTVFSKTR